MTKSAREIMEILEAYDLTRCAHSAAELVGCDEKTVARYVAMRDAGGDPTRRPHRPRAIDPYLDKIEELVDKSRGDHVLELGFLSLIGAMRTTFHPQRTGLSSVFLSLIGAMRTI